MEPAVSAIETIVVGEENDEIHSAASGGLLELSQQTSGESARTLSLVHTKVDNPEDTHDLIIYSEDSELDTHLRDDPTAILRDVSEMRRDLEVGPRRIA